MLANECQNLDRGYHEHAMLRSTIELLILQSFYYRIHDRAHGGI
ncbi:hypothetical protein ACQ4M3_32110 [Leptolyngbya sp. AN03gr2]